MELQTFIQTTPDYLKELKKQNVYVRNYSKLNLAIVKCHVNQRYDYQNNPWLRYCRGAVINTNTNMLVCVPPSKAIREENLKTLTDTFSEENEYQPLIEGTMINVFYHNDEWMISTRSNIGAKNYWDGKTPFYEMFMESIPNNEWFDDLSKDCCYSFVLIHRKNRIVCPVNMDSVYQIECHKMGETIEPQQLRDINGIYSNVNLNRDTLENYNGELPFVFKGFTIKKKGLPRINWINPNYSYVNNLKMNHNDKFLNYISLRQNNLLKEYLKFFPEDGFLFNDYRTKFNSIKFELHESYLDVFVRKEKTKDDVNYALKPLIYELHKYYLKDPKKNIVTTKVVNNYLHNLPGKKIMFICNYLFQK